MRRQVTVYADSIERIIKERTDAEIALHELQWRYWRLEVAARRLLAATAPKDPAHA